MLTILAFLGLAACQSTNKQVDSKDLLHHNFVLVSIDDKPFTGDRVPNLEFNEDMRISGGICNRYVGQAQLQNSTLTVPNMASTKMICNNELDELEGSMSKMLVNGAKLTLQGNVLTLEDNEQKLTFHLKDAVN